MLDRAKAVAAKLKTPFRHFINEVLHAGRATVAVPLPVRCYRTQPHEMGLKPGRNLDDIQGLLSGIEGDDHR
ncbi:MAG: hypothetical protein RBS80_05895 [Thermoguttaceae bacterium]|jgi:hypothetical protein|nr:hypothetical protein [Thermoguttaceae bacterium]